MADLTADQVVHSGVRPRQEADIRVNELLSLPGTGLLLLFSLLFHLK